MSAAGRIRWFDGLEPVHANVACRGERHRLSWVDGRLVAEHHDLAVERAFAAMGGDSAPCLDVMDAVANHLGDVGPFPLWTAEPETAALSARQGRAFTYDLARAGEERRLDALCGLPLPLRRRLALAAFVAVSRRSATVEAWRNPSLGWVLSSLLRPAVAASLAAARPQWGGGHQLEVSWVGVPAHEVVTAEGWADAHRGYVRLRLHLDWPAVVWAHGLACGGEGSALVLDRVPKAGCRGLIEAAWSPPDARGRSHLERRGAVSR
ncbi:MAG: hypothetical protein OEY23_06525 [Acidimicrobiia bacterium]|nr:hypothetical protein [Acidimicrobiia bacterium]